MKIYDYSEAYGEVSYPEGFLDEIKNRSIEEQAEYFRIFHSKKFENTNWGSRSVECSVRLDKCEEVTGIILKDNCVAGVMVRAWTGKEVALLPENGVCTYIASDNNGAGYKEREDFTYLACVRPENKQK